MMKIRLVSANKTHKAMEAAVDCVDAFDISEDRRRMAVSDGVTRSLYPGEFANSVVRGFCQVADASDWHKWMSQARERWLEKAEDRVEELKRKQSPAYVNNQGRLDSRVPGAATFAGVEFDPETNSAKLIIMGDSCVFVYADGKLADSFPCKKSSEFDNQPNAFQSYAPDKNRSEPEPEIRDLPAVPDGAKGAHWVFATDALAMWILTQHEKSVNALPRLLAIKDEASFKCFVDNARKADKGALCDDVTLVVASAGEPELPFQPYAEEPDAAAGAETSAQSSGAANPNSPSVPSSPSIPSTPKHRISVVAPPNSPSRIATFGKTLGNAAPYSPEGASIYGNKTSAKKNKRRGLKIAGIFLAVIAIVGAVYFFAIKPSALKNDAFDAKTQGGGEKTNDLAHATRNTDLPDTNNGNDEKSIKIFPPGYEAKMHNIFGIRFEAETNNKK